MSELYEGKPALGEPNRMTPEIEQTLDELFCRFREKFGRDPGENDPIFFDPHSDQPIPSRQEALNEMWERLADAMVCQGEITPEIAYAMKKTGLLVTEQTKDLLRDNELDEWNKALAEYGSVGTTGLDKPMTPHHDGLSSLRSVRPTSEQTTHVNHSGSPRPQLQHVGPQQAFASLGFTARTKALMNFPSTCGASASTSMPCPERNSRASSAR